LLKKKTIGHYGLLILPLSIITVFCFGFLLLQSPTKLTKEPAASTKRLPQKTPSVAGLPMAALDQMPHLAPAPTVSTVPDDTVPTTTSPQQDGDNLINLQDASQTKLNVAAKNNSHKNSKPKTKHHDN